MDIEQEAKLQGWVPAEEFKGSSDKWVDAESYVERGKHIMPILQSNNKRLLSELDSVKSVVESLKVTVNTQNQSMEELKAFHQESTKAQVEKARREILSSLKEAKSDGDIDQEIQLTADLSKFDAAQVAAKEAPAKVTQAPAPQELHPDTKAWMDANPWYGKDPERTGLMDGVAKRMRAENSPLVGMSFLEAAASIVADRFADKPTESKVDGGGRGGVSTGNASGYSGLPSDAKAICDKGAVKFVGADKPYKTKKEWQDFYVSEYNKGN
jgi:hypothetical protein